jgi:hypothetical protein
VAAVASPRPQVKLWWGRSPGFFPVALAWTMAGRSTACGWPALSSKVVVVRAESGPRWAQTGHDLVFFTVFNIDRRWL